MNKIITFLAAAFLTIPTYLFAAQSQNLESLLLEAASAGQTDIVKSFLDHGANIEIKNDAGATPLIFASVKGHADVVKLLLDRGANVNARTNSGITPLIAAASAGNEAIVQLLLEKGADLSARDQQGRTALDIAQATGDTQVYALLKSREGTAPVASAHVPVAQSPVVQSQVVQPPVAQSPATQAPVAQVHNETIREADNPSGLTVRSEPSPQGKVMAYLPVGSNVSYSGEPNNGWVKMSGPIADGWIAAKYVGSGDGEASVIRVDSPDQCLRVRKGPGGNYDKIGCLPMGAKVKVAGPAQNSWAKIVSPMEGWVSAGQIQGPGVFPTKAAASGVQKARPATSQSAGYRRERSDSDSDFDRTSRQMDREMSDLRAQTQSSPIGPQVLPGSSGFGIGPLGIGPGGIGFR